VDSTQAKDIDRNSSFREISDLEQKAADLSPKEQGRWVI